MTYPFGQQQPVAESDKGLRLAALHLAAHVLDRPPVVTEESSPSGLAVVKEISAPERVAEVINGGTAFMEFIERTGAISPHKVALETLRDLLDAPTASEYALTEPLRAVVRGALGGH